VANEPLILAPSKKLGNRVDRNARISIHVWYLVQIALNRPEVLVIFQLDAAMKFQIIQRAAHTAIGQAREWLELNCCTFRPYDYRW
jgi:hypothetical protein